ncbi:hypothetical protein BDZ89DRAFT_1167869 [Hymenopellis radicata]|nr:hypothetical protein BDZ89DRAFT_1167869 [Hymenopellis radicata]
MALFAPSLFPKPYSLQPSTLACQQKVRLAIPFKFFDPRPPGTVLRADVDGHIQMRAHLSGTPKCKFGLNDKLVMDKSEKGMSDAVELDDCPPMYGEFELMWWVPSDNERQTPSAGNTVSYDVTVKSAFGNKLSTTNVVLRIPTPLNTTSVDCQVATGKAKYVPGENVVVWKIPRLQGGQECTFSGTVELTSTTRRQVWARSPIDVDFQVVMFTSSGLIVRFLKVFEKSNYNSIKWVRYLTKASGSYQIRFLCSPPWHVNDDVLLTSELLGPLLSGFIWFPVFLSLTPMGNVFIAGSNPNNPITNTSVKFPSEFRVEYLNPPFMTVERPVLLEASTVQVALMDLGFSSHAFHSSSRLVFMTASLSQDQTELTVLSPPNNGVFPPGPGPGLSPPAPDQGVNL